MIEQTPGNSINPINPINPRKPKKVIQKAFLPIDPEQLAIAGDDGDHPENDLAELHDVTNGHHFLYFFAEDTELEKLLDNVQAGANYFSARFRGLPAQVVIFSSAYGWDKTQVMHGLQVIELPEIPPGHFWFGPKPNFYQLALPF
jgi:hypothetical protein